MTGVRHTAFPRLLLLLALAGFFLGHGVAGAATHAAAPHHGVLAPAHHAHPGDEEREPSGRQRPGPGESVAADVPGHDGHSGHGGLRCDVMAAGCAPFVPDAAGRPSGLQPTVAPPDSTAGAALVRRSAQPTPSLCELSVIRV